MQNIYNETVYMDLWDWYSSTIKARVFYKILILSGSETGMLYEKLINTVAADQMPWLLVSLWQ